MTTLLALLQAAAFPAAGVLAAALLLTYARPLVLAVICQLDRIDCDCDLTDEPETTR